MESKSNINYLQILWEPVINLYDVKSPNNILIRLPDIFMKFIFILEESPYYNKWYFTVIMVFINLMFNNYNEY